jgi:ppGpp synthetase/RelA/SpoT-type nucleotidyltranferase
MPTWAVPEYSRNQVDKAGDLLLDKNIDFFDLAEALKIINNWRSSHSYPLLNFRINLARKLKNICPNAVIAQRIKRLVSIEAKLLSKKSMQLSQMQDIGGCRAIVNDVAQVRALVESYKTSRFSHIFRGEKNYVDTPKPDGYRSYHLIYQYKARQNQNAAYDKLRIEIQIRTKMQHAWATGVEAVGIFTNEALKANIGNKDWLRLFALMASEIAVDEKTNLVPGMPENQALRVKELKELEKKLKAIRTLNAYSTTIQWAGKNVKNTSYFLMTHDFNKNQIQVQEFAQGRSQEANLAYTQAESAITDGSKNIVLVAVDSVNALKRAYPNYFLDTRQFSAALARCVGK